ncbi:MAG: CvpA family protein [Christensenellaceae bacterium]|jgi:uncharacterized membrane protein required for colicin V production
MNIIDLVVIAMIALYFISGCYRGFLSSLLNLGGVFFAWIISFFTYPILSDVLVNSKFFQSIRFYLEGGEKIKVEYSRQLVSSLTDNGLTEIMDSAKLSSPYSKAITQNISKQVFADQGLTTVGEYFDLTIYNVIMNIIAFVILFVCLRVLFTLFTNAFSYSMELPQLQRFDAPLGGIVSLFRGFFSMHVLFMFVPIGLMIFPEISELLNNSFTTSLFYSGSVILPFISGKL